MNLGAKFKPKSIQVEMVVTKADGRVIDLGVVDAYHRNPLIRLWLMLKIAYRVRQRGRDLQNKEQ